MAWQADLKSLNASLEMNHPQFNGLTTPTLRNFGHFTQFKKYLSEGARLYLAWVLGERSTLYQCLTGVGKGTVLP